MNKQELFDVQYSINLINYVIRDIHTHVQFQPAREKLLKAVSVLGQLRLSTDSQPDHNTRPSGEQE